MHMLSRSLAVFALACALVAGAVSSTATSAGATTATGDCTPGSDWGIVRDDFAAQTITLVNAHRASLGLAPLTVSSALQASAVWKARHMAKYNYMAHADPAPPVARSTGERMAACGVTGGWGENIAAGYPTPASVVNGWLGSPGHRANIENASYTAIGSGAAASSSGQIFWAHTFSTAGGSAPPPPAPVPPPPPPPAPVPAPPPPAPAASRTGSSPTAAVASEGARAPACPAGPAGSSCSAGAARGQSDGRSGPAQLPCAHADATATGCRGRAREHGDRAEAGCPSEERTRLLQRPLPGPPTEGARPDAALRIRGLCMARPARGTRPGRQRRSDRAAGPSAGVCTFPRQHLLTPV